MTRMVEVYPKLMSKRFRYFSLRKQNHLRQLEVLVLPSYLIWSIFLLIFRKEKTMITILILVTAAWIGGAGLGVAG